MPRYAEKTGEMCGVRTPDGYELEVVEYEVPAYARGWVSDPVEAAITLNASDGFAGKVTLSVEAPDGIEAVLTQADVDLRAGGSAEVGLRVSVDSAGPMAGSYPITVRASDGSETEADPQERSLIGNSINTKSLNLF